QISVKNTDFDFTLPQFLTHFYVFPVKRGGIDRRCSFRRVDFIRTSNMGPEDSNPWDINFSEDNKHPIIFTEPSGSEHLETYPEVTARIGSSDFFDINPEVIVEGTGGHEHSEIHSSLFNVIDSNEHMVMHPNNPFYESSLFSPTKKLRSISSPSSSVSSEDLFQVDTKGHSMSRLSTSSSFKAEEGTTQPASKDDKNVVFSSNPFNSSELNNASQLPTLTCQVSQVTHGLPPTQSPPIQVMDRSGMFDPLRIPSSIFENDKSLTLTPQDWSTASNESLFSIQIGNNSFSREVMLGTELFKSEELTKSRELLMFSPNPPVPMVETDEGSIELEKGRATTGDSDERTEDMTRETSESQSKERSPPAAVSSNAYSISDESSRSFAFPIMKKKDKCARIPNFCCRKKCRWKKCAWPSCYCSNCSCTFCYCKWPSCHLRWPSCSRSNCSWAFCYSWNCSKWCCHSSNILTDGVKSGLAKENAEKQQQQSLASDVTSKSTCCNWFCCCFSPRPSCCRCHWRWHWSWSWSWSWRCCRCCC
ncbi:hypothetical protein Ddye_030842, partial [Dipteronia dyeriana]